MPLSVLKEELGGWEFKAWGVRCRLGEWTQVGKPEEKASVLLSRFWNLSINISREIAFFLNFILFLNFTILY